MLTYQNHTVKTSVRKLVEFLLRSGDISTGDSIVSDPKSMLEGAHLHRKIQNAKKAGYRSEVPLKTQWEQEDYTLVLEGRADGIEQVDYEDRRIWMIDEIKCVYKVIKEIQEAEPLHLAQAKCYAFMYGSQQGAEEMLVQITYCHMETEEIRYITERFSMEELTDWFDALTDSYRLWADTCVQARKKRNASIARLTFPFTYRPGQKKLTAMVYHAINKKENIFLQAPTGVGKTISTLYPALKALGEEKSERLFYLTAKTITRTVAEQTLSLLRKQGMSLWTVSITAKEKICVCDSMDCNPESCARAKGHFDRINTALYAMLTGEEAMERETILAYSEKFQVCPYALSFEAAVWADCIICDYNYVFDPHVNKKSLFGEQAGVLLLIDEAHNLLDRAREMYSASLQREDIMRMHRIFRKYHKGIAGKLQSCGRRLLDMAKDPEQIPETVEKLYYPLFRLLGSLEEYMKEHPEMEEREEAVEIYFRLRHFFMILDTMEEGYQIYGEGEKNRITVRLLCVDPSSRLAEYLDRCRSGIFFSATLLPIQYYRQLLGGNHIPGAFSIASPFDRRKKLLAITSDVTSLYSSRGPEQYERIVRYLEETVSVRKGNYMIFFPSYEMLENTVALAENSTLPLLADLRIQNPSMNEKEREEFLHSFEEQNSRSLIGFCVLGSIFSEGIDLTGQRLIGVLIVGTGLPQICGEREKIRAYFDSRGKKGYDYAYRYPGMNKVLQAAGRVIRTAEDVGVILLMDHRFLYRENQQLLPEEWDTYYEVTLNNYRNVLQKFWEKYTEQDLRC